MRNRKNEAEGLITEVIYAVLYCGVFLALVFLIVR
jgi:hypothetical protein